MKIRLLLLLIDSPCYCFLYFYSTQIKISVIILLGMSDSVGHLGKLKLVGFKGFVIGMSLLLASKVLSQNIQ